MDFYIDSKSFYCCKVNKKQYICSENKSDGGERAERSPLFYNKYERNGCTFIRRSISRK